MQFISYLQMPFRFDATRLQADLGRVCGEPWVLHGNRFIYRGEWSGLSLCTRFLAQWGAATDAAGGALAHQCESAAQRGTANRVHLVIDAGVNEWLRGQVEARHSPWAGGDQ